MWLVRHVMQTLKEEYDRMSEKQMDTADPELDMEPPTFWIEL